jgi:hypothetical protein
MGALTSSSDTEYYQPTPQRPRTRIVYKEIRERKEKEEEGEEETPYPPIITTEAILLDEKDDRVVAKWGIKKSRKTPSSLSYVEGMGDVVIEGEIPGYYAVRVVYPFGDKLWDSMPLYSVHESQLSDTPMDCIILRYRINGDPNHNVSWLREDQRIFHKQRADQLCQNAITRLVKAWPEKMKSYGYVVVDDSQ